MADIKQAMRDRVSQVSKALTDMKMLTVVNSSGYLERMVSDLITSGQYRHHLKRLRDRIGKATARALGATGDMHKH